MVRSIEVPLTKARGFGPFPDLLERRLGIEALHEIFDAEDVPLEVIERGDTLIPFTAMVGLFERAGEATGDRAFGMKVGLEMKHMAFGPWMEYSAAAPTLGEALLRTIRTGHMQQIGGTLALINLGKYSSWRYIPPKHDRTHRQHSDHIIGPMLRFVRSYLGTSWQPAWVELNYQRDPEAEAIEALLPTTIRFDQPGVGIAMLTNSLAHSRLLPPPRALTFLEVAAVEASPDYADPIKSLYAIVFLRLMDGKSDLDGAADMASVGVQILQRTLREEGLSYQKLVEIVRSDRAKVLLKASDQPVTDIAFVLGYSDHANFTRAFKRWLGCSPSDYRKYA